MTKHEAYSALIKLAGEMVRGEGLPSPFYEDHKFYRTTPMGDRRVAIKNYEAANERARLWGIRLKDVADAIRTPTEVKP